MTIESAYIELTNLCNLNCKTCYNRSGLNHEKKQIPLDVFWKSIEQFQHYGLKSVLLSGGETMLYDDIIPLFEKIKDHPALPFTISTNGTVSTETLISHYRSTPNLFVQISLDGSCEEINSRTRGAGHFEKSLQLLTELENSNRPVGYRLKMVVSKYNLDDIPAYFKLAMDYECDPLFAFMNPMGNGGDNWDEMALSDSDKMKALRYIDDCNKQYGTDISLPFCAFSCPFADEMDNIKLGCMVKNNGDIMPCQGLYDEKFRLGNIFSFNDCEILDNMEQIRALTYKRKEQDYGCKNCLIKPICKRGCPAIAVMHGSDFLASDTECSFRLRHYLKYQLRN